MGSRRILLRRLMRNATHGARATARIVLAAVAATRAQPLATRAPLSFSLMMTISAGKSITNARLAALPIAARPTVGSRARLNATTTRARPCAIHGTAARKTDAAHHAITRATSQNVAAGANRIGTWAATRPMTRGRVW